jgi:hypothetical protein
MMANPQLNFLSFPGRPGGRGPALHRRAAALGGGVHALGPRPGGLSGGAQPSGRDVTGALLAAVQTPFRRDSRPLLEPGARRPGRRPAGRDRPALGRHCGNAGLCGCVSLFQAVRPVPRTTARNLAGRANGRRIAAGEAAEAEEVRSSSPRDSDGRP